MKTYTIEELKEKFDELSYKWLPFMLIGIRSKEDTPNKFDDVFIIVENDKIKAFPNTTNPGVFWLKNPINTNGSAVLKPGQYIDSWALGLHRGKYEALVQVRDVVVYRDKDRDIKSEETNIEQRGLFGINIHRANSVGLTSLVDKHSAGCQVFQNVEDFNYVIERCKKSRQKYFTYTLLKEF